MGEGALSQSTRADLVSMSDLKRVSDLEILGASRVAVSGGRQPWGKRHIHSESRLCVFKLLSHTL